MTCSWLESQPWPLPSKKNTLLGTLKLTHLSNFTPTLTLSRSQTFTAGLDLTSSLFFLVLLLFLMLLFFYLFFIFKYTNTICSNTQIHFQICPKYCLSMRDAIRAISRSPSFWR